MEKWYITNPKLFEDVKRSIRENFPTLTVVVENDIVFIRGILLLPEEIDKFIIEIELLEDYPESVPVVRETGKRIPHGERHVFMHGDCCLFVNEEKWKHYPKETTIIDFINKIVVPYFLAQSYFEIKGKWLWGERSHGAKGILEFYQEELNTKDFRVIIQFINYLAKSTIKRNRICYCGSNKKLQHCHFLQLSKYRSVISSDTAKFTLRIIAAEVASTK